MNIESYEDEVRGFVNHGNYHAAINVALSGLNECRRNGDQAGIDQCLSVIRAVIQHLAEEFGSKEYLARISHQKDEPSLDL
jgi:hypothetical protein